MQTLQPLKVKAGKSLSDIERLVRERRGVRGDEQFYDSLGKIVVVKLFVDAGPARIA